MFYKLTRYKNIKEQRRKKKFSVIQDYNDRDFIIILTLL